MQKIMYFKLLRAGQIFANFYIIFYETLHPPLLFLSNLFCKLSLSDFAFQAYQATKFGKLDISV